MAKVRFENVKMELVREQGTKVNMIVIKETPELDLNTMMELLVQTAKKQNAEALLVPFTAEYNGETLELGLKKNFIEYSLQCGVKLINKKNIKEETTMTNNKTKLEVIKGGAGEVVASAKAEAVATTEDKDLMKTAKEWAEIAKKQMTDMVQDIKDAGLKITGKDTDTVLEEIEEGLNDLINRGKAMFACRKTGQIAEKNLETLKQIMAEAKDKIWTETLKAIALWVVRKVWALTKGIGMFAWDTLILTINTVYNYGRGVIKLAEIDIVNAVQQA